MQKSASQSLACKTASFFFPLQLGVGVGGGCEAILHAAREGIEKQPDKWLSLVDWSSAYNNMNMRFRNEISDQEFPWYTEVGQGQSI